jgi:uncharacterized protein (TIGR00266 family)
MQAEITGTTLPVLQIQLQPGEVLVAETGQLAWMTSGIALNTTTQTAGVRGLFGAIGRALSGGGLFMTEFSAPYGPGGVAFAAHAPGQIMEMQVDPGRAYLIHRNGFLCATQGVALGTAFQQSFSAGLFGGAGFLLQKIEGQGTAWVELGGDVVPYDLPPGESLLVHPGLVGMFEASVAFEITRFSGIKNILFGGDGLFLVRLTGPGRVWLQTLALANFAHALQPYLSTEKSGTSVSESRSSWSFGSSSDSS